MKGDILPISVDLKRNTSYSLGDSCSKRTKDGAGSRTSDVSVRVGCKRLVHEQGQWLLKMFWGKSKQFSLEFLVFTCSLAKENSDDSLMEILSPLSLASLFAVG